MATESAGAATGRYAANYHTIYDGIIGPWFLDRFLTAAGLDEVDYAIIRPSIEVCIERVRTRINHSFDDESATRKMHNEFTNAKIDPRFILVDDESPAATIADTILARRSAGTLRYARPPA